MRQTPQRQSEQSRVDQREKWITSVIYDYYRGSVKVDKLNKYLSSDDCLGYVRDFMDVPDERFLMIKESSKGVEATNRPPTSVKTRMLYFLKTKSQALPGHNYERLVLVGDMTDDSLKHLNEVAQ